MVRSQRGQRGGLKCQETYERRSKVLAIAGKEIKPSRNQ